MQRTQFSKQQFLNYFREHIVFWLSLIFVIILSAITYHGDFMWLTRLSERIAGGNLDLYQPLIVQSADVGKFTMPPLIGLLDGGLYYIFKSVGIISFDLTTSLAGNVPPLHLLLLKSRYILLFILSYPLILKAALSYTNGDRGLSKKIANLWITSPLLIYLPFTQGNNDIFPVLSSILFLLFAFKRQYFWAMVALGLTAALKNYAVFLFIPMAIILAEKDIKLTIRHLAVAVAAYAIPAIAYLHQTLHFLESKGEGTLFLNTYLPSSPNFLLAPILYVLLLAHLYFSNNLDNIRAKKNEYLALYGFLTLSILFVLTTFIPQWFFWLLPFAVFLIIKTPRLVQLFAATLAAFFGILFTNWPSNLDLRLFSPLLPASIAVPPIRPESLSTGDLPSIVASVFSALLIAFAAFAITDITKTGKAQSPFKYGVWINIAPLLVVAALTAGSLGYNLYQANKEEPTNTAVYAATQSKSWPSLQRSSEFSVAGDENAIASIGSDGIIRPTKVAGVDITLTAPNSPLTSSGRTYIAMKLSAPEDRLFYRPTLFIERANPDFVEDEDAPKTLKDSTDAFTTYDGKFFYAPVEAVWLKDVSKLTLRLNYDSAPFSIDYIKVVSR